LIGTRRFDQFQGNLGIARNILAARLKKLAARGILERTVDRALKTRLSRDAQSGQSRIVAPIAYCYGNR